MRSNTVGVEMDAAYSDELKAICPQCWSFPDINNRVEDIQTVGTVEFNDRTLSVIQTKYTCSNPDCPVIVCCKGASVRLSDRLALPWVNENILNDSHLEEYMAGVVQNGVWLSEAGETKEVEETPEEKENREVQVTFKKPWSFISVPSPLNEEVPKNWTRDGEGRIKARVGTDRHFSIVQWFRKKGINIPSEET